MKNVAHTNLLCVSFEPTTIRIAKKTATPQSLKIPFANAFIVQLYPTLKRSHPTYVDCLLNLMTLMQMRMITIINIFRVFQNSPHRINWSLKINIKNCFIPQRLKEPTCCHEYCLTTIISSFTPILVKVAANLFSAIKRKDMSLEGIS